MYIQKLKLYVFIYRLRISELSSNFEYSNINMERWKIISKYVLTHFSDLRQKLDSSIRLPGARSGHGLQAVGAQQHVGLPRHGHGDDRKFVDRRNQSK